MDDGTTSKASTNGSELTAASALTSLHMPQKIGCKDCHDEEDGDFYIPERFTKSGRKRAVPFPLKLMKVLSNKEYAEIITWMPSGKSFNILKPKAFVADILPDHFKSAKYSSFTRKLHRWGFMRHYRGDEAGAFYHKHFQKDRLDLVEEMTCHKTGPPAVKVAQQCQQAQKQEQQKDVKASPAPRVSRTKCETTTQAPRQMEVEIPCAAATTSTLPAHPQLDASERLNAAIELEVARRLKERIAVAALSRQALPYTGIPSISSLAWNATAPSRCLTNPVNTSLLLRKQALLKQAMLEQVLLKNSAPAQAQPLSSMPTTNIQGAKTA